MLINVIMPQMGESILEATVTRWLKKVGEQVRRDDSLFEVSTDKVDSEIPAPADGVLSEILVKEGVTVKIGDVVAVIAEAPFVEAVPAPVASPILEASPQPEAEAVVMPAPVSSPILEASPQPKAETVVTTAPAASTILEASPQPEAESVVTPAPVAGTEESPITKAAELPPPEMEVPPAAAPADVVVEPEDAQKAANAPTPAAETTSTVEGAAPPSPAREEPQKFIHTSPLVRRIARDYGVALSEIPATGISGRITREDILEYLRGSGKLEPSPARPQSLQEEPADSAPMELPSPGAPVPDVPRPSPMLSAVSQQTTSSGVPAETLQSAEAPLLEAPKFSGDTEAVTMTPMRKAIAEHMILSRRTSAHVQTVFEVDMTSIVRLREKHMAEFEARHGLKLTYTPFLVKALVDTVKEFPILNCSVSGDRIIYKKAINVGVAVALDTGLIVPVVKDAHLRSFGSMASDIRDLADRARTKKLKPEDVQSGTITITNPGVYGALFGTPIIHQPQVAILGVGSFQKRPVIIHDAIAIRTMVYLVLSFDHRIIDGAVADQAMSRLKARLESWCEWKE